MNTIYLDNAATTPILPEVIDLVCETMQLTFGNPSSSHQVGKKAKSLVENARKNIAKQFGATASEIYFTAGATEADNLILRNAVLNLQVKTIISSKIEHHAVLHTIESLEKEFNITVLWVKIDENGQVDYEHLQNLLQTNSSKKLVSLMHVNNEIGTILDLQKVSELCQANSAFFHSDAVQGVGHFSIDLQKTPIDFFVSSAHKYHGPKGVGFAYIKKGLPIFPILHGGEQEKGVRAGTENVHSIVGMEKALLVACSNMEKDAAYIQNLKSYFSEQLKLKFPDSKFNGNSNCIEASSYIILNVQFPKALPMLLLNLDLKGIAVSGGSACQSGSNKGSHVLNEILSEEDAKNTSVRFSFSKFNTIDELKKVIEVLKDLIK